MNRSTLNITRIVAGVGAIALLAGCGGGSSDPADYPSKQVRMVVPYDAGGNVDTQARALAPCMEDELGQRFIVENAPGSGGTIGTRDVANAEPDGYTLSLNSVSPFTVGPRVVENAGYATEDLESYGIATAAPIVFFVSPDSPYTTLEDLVEASKEQNISIAVPGTNTLQDLIVKGLNESFDADFSIVPIDSTTEVARGVVSGDYAAGVTAVSLDLLPRIDSGEIEVIARGGDEAYEYLGDVPTYEAAGYANILPTTEVTIPLIGPTGIPE